MVLILEKSLQLSYTYYVGKILNYYIPNRIDYDLTYAIMLKMPKT